MDERERLRLRLTSAVMKLVRDRGLREELPPLREDGAAPFVVALPGDTLSEISRRAELVGGRAHVIIIDELGNGKARLRVFRVEPDGEPVTGIDGGTNSAVADGWTIDTVLQLAHVGETLRFRAHDGDWLIRFLADSVKPAPAA